MKPRGPGASGCCCCGSGARKWSSRLVTVTVRQQCLRHPLGASPPRVQQQRRLRLRLLTSREKAAGCRLLTHDREAGLPTHRTLLLRATDGAPHSGPHCLVLRCTQAAGGSLLCRSRAAFHAVPHTHPIKISPAVQEMAHQRDEAPVGPGVSGYTALVVRPWHCNTSSGVPAPSVGFLEPCHGQPAA
jgi:hypothetical protein